MRPLAEKSAYARLIGVLIVVAVLATLARLIPYAAYRGDVARQSLE